MATVPSKNFNKNHKPGDGMSVAGSTIEQRSNFLEKTINDPEYDYSDCVQYGFYFGQYMNGPIPAYNGNEVQHELITNT